MAILLRNQIEVSAVVLAAQRAGLLHTPVNRHLSAAEAAYVVRDRGARMLVSAAGLEDVAAPAAPAPLLESRVVVGEVAGRESPAEAIADLPGTPTDDEVEGGLHVVLVGHHRPAQGDRAAARRRPLRHGRRARQLDGHGLRLRPRHDLPVPRPETASAYDDRGWSTLGDLGHLDEDGFLHLSDRRSDLIISGGVNIYPREVEDVPVLHPAVADVAVIGLPDEEMGQRVHAVVQPADPTADPAALAQELRAFVRDRIAHFKAPRTFSVEPEFPRLPSGKVLRRVLMDRLTAVEKAPTG